MGEDSLREIPFEVLGLTISWISEGEQALVSQVSKNFQFVVDKNKFKIQISTAVSSIPLLQWSLRNDLSPYTYKVTKSSITSGKSDVLRYLVVELKYQMLFDARVCAYAAYGGRLEVLRILRSGELGAVCPWDEWVCAWASRRGHLDFLRALRSGELGGVCPWNSVVCEWAAQENHLEVLRALRSGELGGVCPWNSVACTVAAHGGRLEVLKALRSGELGGVCPWNKWSCTWAASRGYLEILRALRSGELGGVCPWDKEECLIVSHGHQAIQDLINSGELDD